MDIDSLHFRRWTTPHGTSASALFIEPLNCGIYLLEFANGEEYVGQTLHFHLRFSSHRRRWDDIRAISFAPVVPQDLDSAERAVIARRVQEGVRLRNLTLLSQPLGSSPLDLVIDKQVQAEWLTADMESGEIQLGQLRPLLARRRIASRQKFEQLRSHPLYEQVLLSVAFYVAMVIPWPDQTEGRHWTLTAFPGTARSGSNRRLTTLSIHNVELLIIGEAREEDEPWEAYTLFNTALIPMMSKSLRPFAEITDNYKSAGTLHTFSARGADALADLLTVPEVMRAARSLALGQLRKGRAVFSRFHNDAFADEVFALIDTLLAEE